MGIETLLPKVTNAEMEVLDSVLKRPGDKREGQLLANYDRVYMFMKDVAITHNIPLPPLFEKDDIDRTCMIYFNTNQEVCTFSFLLIDQKYLLQIIIICMGYLFGYVFLAPIYPHITALIISSITNHIDHVVLSHLDPDR